GSMRVRAAWCSCSWLPRAGPHCCWWHRCAGSWRHVRGRPEPSPQPGSAVPPDHEFGEFIDHRYRVLGGDGFDVEHDAFDAEIHIALHHVGIALGEPDGDGDLIGVASGLLRHLAEFWDQL